MKNDGTEIRRVSGYSNEPAIQVICLVSGSCILCVRAFRWRCWAQAWIQNNDLRVRAHHETKMPQK
jgi:hypothetical protein